MNQKKQEIKNLLVRCKMKESTITGVMKLLKNEEDIEKTLNYIKRYKKILTDHQIRQYMMQILIWDKK